MTAPIISSLGARALLFDAGGAFSLTVQERIWALARKVDGWDEVRETCPGVTNLTVVTWGPSADLEERLLETWEEVRRLPKKQVAPGRLLEIPVVYDGVDLELVSRLSGLSPAEVIARHAAPTYSAFAIGSHPGFGYLGPLDPVLEVPRRAEPRISMPAGTVSIAGAQTGVSASDGPTGWHVLGRTSLRMFVADRDPPALLAAGDRVRFVPVARP
ncbi:5-oxoprolinase subunit PxpB [Tropicimonas isoalkanivorans]|uniref:Sensor histidine kinase inhibitor, KipI family n=1 Tax=Tropicimonas isoalkanivorans TaxID=441112 RepID=A0A1I1HP96_9RHOB|nr:5-oxoprolinase subunit PxpB [Tropicimonas isoalkanivorans]SFC25615.1 sensor histidine kinase inhibitor, KipI family [Tropicimonas isoalkanivorans]